MYEKIIVAADYIKSKLDKMPKIGIILGSGLQPLADEIKSPIIINYSDVPNMPFASAPGHIARFVCGEIEGKQVICMQGRLHGYEGHQPEDIVFPVRVMKFLGVKTLILTNASGGINTNYSVGDFMMITDHINFTGKSPLTGKNDDRIGPRFHDMTFTYTPALQEIARNASKKTGIKLHEGVYIGVNGPQFETPAENTRSSVLGADAVGMSTIFEAIEAAHCSINVLGIAMITNMAAGIVMKELSGSEVNETADNRGEAFRRLVKAIIVEIS